MRENTIVTVIVSTTRCAEKAGGLSDSGEELYVGGSKDPWMQDIVEPWNGASAGTGA